MAICKSCGAENPDNNKFCSTCGAPMETPIEVPVEPVEPVEPIAEAEPVEAPLTPIAPDPYQNTYGRERAQTSSSTSGGDYKIVCLLSLIFGGVGFLINPLYLVSLAALILGIIGVICSEKYKTWAIIGIVLSIVGCFVQILLDLFCTFGLGIFC